MTQAEQISALRQQVKQLEDRVSLLADVTLALVRYRRDAVDEVSLRRMVRELHDTK